MYPPKMRVSCWVGAGVCVFVCVKLELGAGVCVFVCIKMLCIIF